MKFFLQEGEFTMSGPNVRGTSFVQLYQPMPWLEPFYMNWEKNYNAQPVYEAMKLIPQVPVSTSVRVDDTCHLPSRPLRCPFFT